MIEKKLTVIIPVYNNGELTRRAVRSVLTYPKDDLEVLVVDDGSTDNATDHLQELDSRIKVIKKSNGGVSSARNLGIERALGKFILFLDADDQLTADWGRQVSALTDQELVLYNYETNKGTVKNISELRQLNGQPFQEYRCAMIANPTKNLMVWGKFLRKDIIDREQLRFDESLSLAEDGDFMVAYLLKIHSVSLVASTLYRYLDNTDSVMRTFDGKKVAGYLKALRKIEMRLADQSTDLKKAGALYVLMHVNVMMVREVYDIDNLATPSQKKQQMLMLVKEPVIYNALKKISLSECGKPRLIPIALLKLHWYDMARLVFTMRSKRNHAS